MRPKTVTLREYDYHRPSVPPTAHAKANLKLSGSLGGFSNISRSVAFNTDATVPAQVRSEILEVYEHHDEYQETDVDRDYARIHLEQHRRDSRAGEGQSICQRLIPGFRFRLEDHPFRICNNDFAVTKVEHWGQVPEWTTSVRGEQATHLDHKGDVVEELNYRNRFECVPSGIAFRMPRLPRRLWQVTETATVVGPPGSEIYADQEGRIKVQFHWDRDGEFDDRSSCWLRVMQPVGGNGWGHQFIPRVGMEAMVTFLGGDPDKPVVLGSLYNGHHSMPFPLPNATRSGIRTRSTPHSGGHNELSFEDAAGAEELFLRAERNLVQRVEHDQLTFVSRDQQLEVGRAQHERIRGDRFDVVDGKEGRSVKGSQHATIGGDQLEQVLGRKQEQIDGSLTLTANGMQLNDHGCHSVSVARHTALSSGTEKKEGSWSLHVYGPEAHHATRALTLESDTEVVLSCGDSRISILPNSIRIESKQIILAASESLSASGKGPKLQLAEDADLSASTIRLLSKGGAVELDDEAAHVTRPKVNLNCKPAKTPTSPTGDPVKTKSFKWRMLDTQLEPYKNKTYTLITQGFKTKGTTDGDGKIEHELPEDAFSATVSLWTDTYPTGQRLTYSFRLGETPPASSVFGAQLRLRNLGYYLGAESDETTPEFEDALRIFQVDHHLEPSGELDGPTAAKLEELQPS